MAENYIAQFYTWVTGNTITAARLNGNISAIISGLNSGLNAINVLKVLIGGTEVINSSREITLTKATVGNIVLDDGFDAENRFSITATSSGVDIATFALGDNSGATIEVFGSGLLDGSTVENSYCKFSIRRTTGTTTINRINESEFRDGTSQTGYFEVEQSGNNAVLKGYVGSGSWVVAGRYRVLTSSTITVS